MRLVTSVPPRRDGTVIVEDGGQRYTFAANAYGVLEGDAPDGLAAKLIAGGWFTPADPPPGAATQPTADGAPKAKQAAAAGAQRKK